MDIYSVFLGLIQNKITSWKLSRSFVSKDGYSYTLLNIDITASETFFYLDELSKVTNMS